MTGMQPWERDIIEYRPSIGLNTDILSVVTKRSDDEDGRTWNLFEPTPVVVTATKAFGIDMLENVMASLSRATQLMEELERKLVHNPTLLSYKEALENDDSITAQSIYLNHLTDIDGQKEMDVYPVLADSIDEMEVYLDTLNQELFDGAVDYSDLDTIRLEEEQYIIGLLDIESEDLRVLLSEDLTPEQIKLITNIVEDDTSPFSSIEEYLEDLANSNKGEGSPRINYDELATRVQIIASASDKSDFFKELVDLISTHLQSKLSEFLFDDLDGALEYLVDVDGSLTDMKEALSLTFNHHATQAKESYINQLRIAGRDVREFLDKKVSEVRRQKKATVDRLKKFHDVDTFAGDGAQSIMYSILDGVDAAKATWTYIMVEHMGTSEMNIDQSQKLFSSLSEKSKHQSFYQFADLVDREFDRSNKEKELKKFISTHNLHNR